MSLFNIFLYIYNVILQPKSALQLGTKLNALQFLLKYVFILF